MTLAAELDPAALAGSVVIVPSFGRSGGWRVADTGMATAPVWRFPGDAAGARAPRDAFLLFSDIVVGAHALLVLSVPPRGRHGDPHRAGRARNPRVRRLAMGCGASALLAAAPAPNGLLAAAAGAGVPGSSSPTKG